MQVGKVIHSHVQQLAGIVGIPPILGQRLKQQKLPGAGLLTSADCLLHPSYCHKVVTW